MTKRDIKIAIKEFKRRLIDKLGGETEIYLFGSIARGDYGMHSDIDILLPFEPNNSIEKQVEYYVI